MSSLISTAPLETSNAWKCQLSPRDQLVELTSEAFNRWISLPDHLVELTLTYTPFDQRACWERVDRSFRKRLLLVRLHATRRFFRDLNSSLLESQEKDVAHACAAVAQQWQKSSLKRWHCVGFVHSILSSIKNLPAPSFCAAMRSIRHTATSSEFPHFIRLAQIDRRCRERQAVVASLRTSARGSIKAAINTFDTQGLLETSPLLQALDMIKEIPCWDDSVAYAFTLCAAQIPSTHSASLQFTSLVFAIHYFIQKEDFESAREAAELITLQDRRIDFLERIAAVKKKHRVNSSSH